MVKVGSLLAVIVTFGAFLNGLAFKWQLNENFPSDKYFTFSERFMFSDGKGPWIMEQGQSYINVNVDLTTYSTVNASTRIGMAIYATEEEYKHANLKDLCRYPSEVDDNNPWAQAIESEENPTFYAGKIDIYNFDLRKNVTYYRRTTTVGHHYEVKKELWHNVVFAMCSSDPAMSAAGAWTEIVGEVTFRNPYGFIPGELYGILPFEGARMVAYVLFSCFFVFYYYQNRESILPLHNAVLSVFLFALAEATMWYATYQALNLNGQPYCCPFPPTVVASLVLQIFRQTFARTLLLVVCLGYGIVRPKLMTAEWVAITIVTILYLIAAIIAQVSDIVLVQDGDGDPDNSNIIAFKVPELIMDVIFLSWIYLAINSTIRILTEFQQTVKLKMYQQLVTIIGVFAALFTAATVVFVLDDAKVVSWPWQWSWVQQVLWETLNFAVLAAVCYICKPTENSRMLSYASQLPTEDPDEDDDVEMPALKTKGGKPASGSNKLSYADTNDDDEDNYFTARKGVPEKSQHGFGALAGGEEEEDYGLGDN